MQATLIYNPHAGGAAELSSETLLRALRDAGYTANHPKTESEDDLEAALAEVEGLVVIAGGDGTLRAVATRLVGKHTSVLPLPLGTANNVCKALGIRGSAPELLRSLGQKPKTRPLDLGRATGPWGTRYFLEACGFGMFAEALAMYDPEAGKSVLRGVGTALRLLAGHRARRYHLTLDGRKFSDDYLLVEVMNTPATGPRLKLAPEADPGDGLFDVVCVRESDRDNLLGYAKGLLTEELAELPSVEVYRGEQFTVCWDGFPVHLDAKVHATETAAGKTVAGDKGTRDEKTRDEGIVSVSVVPGALEVWLPGC